MRADNNTLRLLAVAAPDATAANSKTCPLNALKSAKTKPVEITMWHSMTRANDETLQKLVGDFNSSQGDVKVDLVNQVDYFHPNLKGQAQLADATYERF